MTEIHKKGSRQEDGNYRPIPLTTVVCKTMYRIVKGDTLERENLIDDSEHGFRNKSRYLTSLLDFFAQFIETYNMNNNKAVYLVYLYFQKPFDKVSHEKLMANVKAQRIQDDTARWIRS